MKSDANYGEKLVLNIHDLTRMGFTRSMAYSLLNRANVPVVQIGGRKFVNAKLFQEWLDEQAASHSNIG